MYENLGHSMTNRGATSTAHISKPKNTWRHTAVATAGSILKNQGKTAILLVLPFMAPLINVFETKMMVKSGAMKLFSDPGDHLGSTS